MHTCIADTVVIPADLFQAALPAGRRRRPVPGDETLSRTSAFISREGARRSTRPIACAAVSDWRSPQSRSTAGDCRSLMQSADSGATRPLPWAEGGKSGAARVWQICNVNHQSWQKRGEKMLKAYREPPDEAFENANEPGAASRSVGRRSPRALLALRGPRCRRRFRRQLRDMLLCRKFSMAIRPCKHQFTVLHSASLVPPGQTDVFDYFSGASPAVSGGASEGRRIRPSTRCKGSVPRPVSSGARVG